MTFAVASAMAIVRDIARATAISMSVISFS